MTAKESNFHQTRHLCLRLTSGRKNRRKPRTLQVDLTRICPVFYSQIVQMYYIHVVMFDTSGFVIPCCLPVDEAWDIVPSSSVCPSVCVYVSSNFTVYTISQKILERLRTLGQHKFAFLFCGFTRSILVGSKLLEHSCLILSQLKWFLSQELYLIEHLYRNWVFM